MQPFTDAHQKQFQTPDINQTNLPLQDRQHFAGEHKDSLIFLELLRYRKNLKDQRSTMKGKLKRDTQSTNSYTGGEKFSNIFSNAVGQIFGRRVITRGQNSTYHYAACKQIFA